MVTIHKYATIAERILSRIEIVRKQNKLTYREIATRIGTAESTISRIASGKQGLTVEWLEKIADALNADIVWLIMPIADSWSLEPIAEQIADVKLFALLIEQFTNRELAPHETVALQQAARKIVAAVLTLETMLSNTMRES